jgi:anti-anti-sigma regulatory factor
MEFADSPRALTVFDRRPPYGFKVWLAGAWGMEARPELVEVLHRMPVASHAVRLDCRRVTLIDGSTMQTMADFADDCASRHIQCTFECDGDPVGRLISIAGLNRLDVLRRPLHKPAQ